jgi:hypothetical protein
MTKARKLAMGAIVAVALLFLALFLLPRFIDFGRVKSRVLAEISQRTGVTVQAAKMEVAFFPRPSITLLRGSISGRVPGVFDALSVYPRILPLFLGRIRLARIDMEGPDLRMEVPALPAAPRGFSLKALEDEAAPVVLQLTSSVPGLVCTVAKGRLTLSDGSRPTFRLDGIEARLAVGDARVEIALACVSNLWRQVSVKGWLEPKGFRGQAGLSVAGLTAGPVVQRLLPALRPQVEDAQGDITLTLRVDGSRRLVAGVETTVDHASLRKGGESLSFQKLRLKGGLRVEGEKKTVSIEGLDSFYPAVRRLSGEIVLDPASSRATARVAAGEVDVTSVRSAFLFFAAQDKDVRDAFHVIRAGSVSAIALSATGASLKNMVKAEHIVAGGNVAAGAILLPESGLEVDGIAGKMRIAGGFLEGSGLSGRMGPNRATEGKIRLDLRESTPGTPFRLETRVTADVGHLPFYLERLAADSDLTKEMEMVHSPRGTAEGRVVFDSLQKPVQVVVDVPSFRLQAAYDRFPYPFDIETGGFHYDKAGGQVSVERLSGTAGRSSFSGLSAQLALGPDPYLTIDSGSAVLSLPEIGPWLRSMAQSKERLDKIGPVQGMVKIDGVSMKGPLARPARWQFRATGSIENVAVQAAGLPGPVEAKTGRFDASQERLSFSDVHAGCLDASTVASGGLAYSMEGIGGADVALEGETGPAWARWASDLVHLPYGLRVRTPLSISNGRFVWEKGKETSIAGDVTVQHGPRISGGLAFRPGELTVEPLVVADGESRASLFLHSRGQTIDCAFKGSLAEGTIDALFAEKGLVTGRIKGNIEAHIVPGKPSASTAKGEIDGSGITIPGFSQAPVKIAAFDLRAQGESALVASDFTAFGRAMRVNGKVAAAKDAFAIDADLTLGGLDLEQIIEQARGANTDEALRDLPIAGTLRVRPEYVSYGGYLWKPVQADVTFSRGPVRLLVSQAEICGIDTPGRVEYDGGRWTVDFLLVSKAIPVQPVFACLLDTKEFTGVLALNGEVTAKGKTGEELMQSLRGKVDFVAKDGRIYRFGTLAKVFEIAGLSAIYAIPDLAKNGFAYSSAKATLEIDSEKITIKDGEIDAASVDLILKGDIEPGRKKVDILVLVVPFTTASKIIKAIPGVRYILEGRLIAIPVRVAGDLGRPRVAPLPPSAVGAELLGMGERVLKIPLKIIQSVLPSS